MIRRILAEPLLHFALIAVVLFLGYGWLNPDSGDNEIVVSKGRVEQMRSRFNSVWQREPTAEEQDILVRTYVLDEIYSREARALGLDKDDAIVRKRLRQKMEFMLQDMAAIEPPTDEQLATFFSNNAERYRTPSVYSFTQVFLSTDRSMGELGLLLEQAGSAIAEGQAPTGDSGFFPAELEEMADWEVSRQFGEQFLVALSESPVGDWHGPVRSGYGVHFLYVKQRAPGVVPELGEVRSRVVSDWQRERNQTFKTEYEDSVLANYEVTVERGPDADE